VNTFAEFIAYAKANPNALNDASPSTGSGPHLTSEMLKLAAGIKTTHVPYAGMAPALNDLIAGHVEMMFDNLGNSLPLVQERKLRGLAVTSDKRVPELPDLPAIAETYPGYEVTLWQGLFAPIGTPPAIVERLRADAKFVRALPEVAERLAAAGAGEPLVTTDAEFLVRIRADYEKFGKVIRGIGARME
jgi:tripartite-type tricarboxylate transporter receptor subunit TctC